FGVDAVGAAQRGELGWEQATSRDFVDAVARLGWDDWCARATPHFLSDTFDPDPWVALALVAGSGRSLAGFSLSDLARVPLVELALRPDPRFDRAIVRDALRAMTLDSSCIASSLRTRTRFPVEVELDARACRVATAKRSAIDPVAPRYWLPPAIGQRLLARGRPHQRITLASLADLDALVDEIADQSSSATAP